MKKTIAFVLAFAMTFATAFSAIGAKTTASAGDGDLIVTAEYEDAISKILITVVKEKAPQEGAQVGVYTDETCTGDRVGDVKVTDANGTVEFFVTKGDGATTYYIKAEKGEDNGISDGVEVPAKAAEIPEDPEEATTTSAANFNVELHPDGIFRATGANYQVQVALATVKNGTAKAIANWDTYIVDAGTADGKVAINPKKDAYYAFRTVSGDGFADPIFFKVVKHSDKYKATITPSGDAYKVTFTGVTDGVKIVGDGEGSGAFVQAIKKDGKETGEYVVGGAITQVGGTLQFIPKGNEAAETVSGKIKYNGAECTVSGNAVKANAKAVNVKIKKQANGPKVAINYAKGIATIPANSLYRVISADAEWTTAEWKKVTTKTPIDLTAGSNVVVQVMKDATAKAIMSKIGTGTITRNVLDLASSDALEYDNEDLKKGLKITNKSSKTVLQYVVSTTAPTKDTKWSTLKTTKSVTIKKGLTGAKLYFRAAAVAKEMKGPGETYSITYEKKELTPTASKDASTVNVKFTEAITGKITVVSGEAAIGSAEITTTAAKEKTITLTTVPTATTKLVIKVELTGASTKLYTVKELEFNYTVE